MTRSYVHVRRTFKKYTTFVLVWQCHQTLQYFFYIGLCWYQKGTDNKWTYVDRTDRLVVDLEPIIALDSMTYIADLDAYELHPCDEKG